MPSKAKRFLNTLMMRTNMAKGRGIDLESKLLAKLMLLEYFQPETFKRFNFLQAENDGTIAELTAFEEGDKVPDDLDTLKQDKWFMNWVNIPPKLGSTDLSAYFYYSRDKLSVISTTSQRMSPDAQEFFKKVKSTSDLTRQAALRQAKSLSQADAAAIFEALSVEVREEGKVGYSSSMLKRLIEYCSERTDLVSQLIQLLNSLPKNKLNIAMRPALLGLSKDTPYQKSMEQFVEKLPKPLNKKQ